MVGLIIHWSFLLFAGIAALIYWGLSKCELTITEKNVKGKTLFGKEVVLPLYQVSAYSTRTMLSTIAVATSSGITKFAMIGNYKEIGETLSKLINARQDNTSAPAQTVVEPAQDNLEDLKKLKDLLDNGIITQEEFDTKKKQLLGL